MLPFRVLVITDEDACVRAARGVVETVARALLPRADGVAVLVRAKGRSRDDVRNLCAALRPISRKSAALLLVHTHVSLVDELDLDGAHLSSSDEPRKARALLRKGKLLGASRHAGDDVGERALAPLDYITMSPVFPPSSKPEDARATLGLEGLQRVVSTSARPVVALGGVDARRAPACTRAGASALAVIGDVMSSHDPRRALLALLER
jgi:thiamine-phosphate pyrophosphorylase